MSKSPTIVWFRTDLRLADQPTLAAAVARAGPGLPVFSWTPEEEQPWAPGKRPFLPRWPSSLPLSALELEPTVNWADGIQASWQPGGRGAHAELERFLEEAVAAYGEFTG